MGAGGGGLRGGGDGGNTGQLMCHNEAAPPPPPPPPPALPQHHLPLVTRFTAFLRRVILTLSEYRIAFPVLLSSFGDVDSDMLV